MAARHAVFAAAAFAGGFAAAMGLLHTSAGRPLLARLHERLGVSCPAERAAPGQDLRRRCGGFVDPVDDVKVGVVVWMIRVAR